MNSCLNVIAVAQAFLPVCMIQEKSLLVRKATRVVAKALLWKTSRGNVAGPSTPVDRITRACDREENGKSTAINHPIFIKRTTGFPQRMLAGSLRQFGVNLPDRP